MVFSVLAPQGEVTAGETSTDCRSRDQTHKTAWLSLFGTDHNYYFKQVNINIEFGLRPYCVTDMKENFTILLCDISHSFRVARLADCLEVPHGEKGEMAEGTVQEVCLGHCCWNHIYPQPKENFKAVSSPSWGGCFPASIRPFPSQSIPSYGNKLGVYIGRKRTDFTVL